MTGTSFKPYTGTTEIDSATETSEGIVELATESEAETGTNTDKAVTPEGVLASITANAPSAGTTSGNASTTARGIIEIATQAETNALTDTSRAVVPARLPTSGESQKGMALLATNALARAGSDDATIMTPLKTKAAIDELSSAGSTDHLAVGTYAFLVSARTTDISAGATATGSLYAGVQLGDFVASNNTTFPTSGLSSAGGTWRAMGNRIIGRTLSTTGFISQYQWHGGLFVRIS